MRTEVLRILQLNSFSSKTLKASQKMRQYLWQFNKNFSDEDF